MDSPSNRDIPDCIKQLNSKRRTENWYGHRIFKVELTEREREELYDEAGRRGLLTIHEFSGISARGVNRRDAIESLLAKTRKRAFELFQKELGACARFWASPSQFYGVDFYWRRARLGVAITGPLEDDVFRADPRRSRDRMWVVVSRAYKSDGLTVMAVPYYEVWHKPGPVVATIRQQLLASGRYPKLRGEP